MISDSELLAYVKPASDDDLPELRRLERAGVAQVQAETGRYYGYEDEIVEPLTRTGSVMHLADAPTSGALTAFEYWDGSAWLDVDTSAYSLFGNRIVFASGVWNTAVGPTQYRATYDFGYTEVDGDTTETPDHIRQAVLLYVTYYFDNRDGLAYEAFRRAFEDSIGPERRMAV